jgi:hypothetical protein
MRVSAAGTPADRRVLLLEKADIVHGYPHLRNAVDSLASDFPELGNVDEIWVVITYAWDAEAVVWFYELFPDLGGRRFEVNTKTGIVVSMR